MKPYGLKRHDELEYSDLGAASKHRKISSKSRKTGRRIMHKSARRAANKEIKNEE